MELQETVDKLTKDNETLLKENGELKASIETEKQAKAKAEAQAAIKEAVAKAELPEPAKARLLEKFADSIDPKGLDEAIKAEKDYIAKLTEASKVKGMGKTEPDTKKAREALKESFKRMHPDWTDAQLENATNGR